MYTLKSTICGIGGALISLYMKSQVVCTDSSISIYIEEIGDISTAHAGTPMTDVLHNLKTEST